MKHLAIRLPDELLRKADHPKLRAYIARNDQVPKTEDEVSRSDVIRAALSFGLEVLSRRADADLALTGQKPA